MIETIEKHGYENKHHNYIQEYSLNEIGDKINEIIRYLNHMSNWHNQCTCEGEEYDCFRGG